MAENTNRKQVIVENIDTLMQVHTPVYDTYGQKVGEVKRFDLTAGYMVVEEGRLARKELYVPFHLMQSITPHEIYLNVSKDALTDAYLLPPDARPRVGEQIDPETGRTEVVLTHEMRSGYDGRPVQIAPVRLDELTRTLTVGMTVLDVDDTYVGEVTRVDTARGLLIVRGSLTTEAVRTVPFGVVAHVDPDTAVVALLVPASALPAER